MAHRLLIAALAALASVPASAQLAPPNPQGVAMGHIHINAADPEVQKTFWTGVVGARLWQQAALSGVEAPGAIIVFRKAVPTGASVGSSVNHIGFIVPAIAPFVPKLEASGYKFVKSDNKIQLMIDGPDGVRVEITEDPAATIPLRFHHIHFSTPNPKEIQAWYAATFGAIAGRRSQWDAADIPGANLTFAQGDSVPTAGRAIDHIGFEVKGLEAFCKKLTDRGVKLDSPYRQLPQAGLALAFLTDPWGTRIELTEGLVAK